MKTCNTKKIKTRYVTEWYNHSIPMLGSRVHIHVAPGGGRTEVVAGFSRGSAVSSTLSSTHFIPPLSSLSPDSFSIIIIIRPAM